MKKSLIRFFVRLVTYPLVTKKKWSVLKESIQSHIEKTIIPDHDMRMAARNFNKIPSDVIEKIKKQHADIHDTDK